MPSNTFISLRYLESESFSVAKIMRSVDGLNWVYVNIPTNNREFGLFSVATDGKGKWLAVGVTIDNTDNNVGLIYTSTDDGQTWVFTEQLQFSVYFIATDSKGTWLAAGKNFSDGTKTLVYKSTDMGKNWLVVNEINSAIALITMTTNGKGAWVLTSINFSSELLFVSSVIQYSTNNGDTWLDADTSALGSTLTLYQIGTDSKGTWLVVGFSGQLESGTFSGFIGKSSDNGKTWQIVYSNPDILYTGLGTDGQGNWLVVDQAGLTNLYSETNGNTWIPYPQAFPVQGLFFGNGVGQGVGAITNTIVADGSGGWLVNFNQTSFNPRTVAGRMFYSPNGRSNWREIPLPTETDINVLLSIAVSATPSLISNICFPGGTPIQTDQGIVPIDLIDTKLHTIHGQPILHITKTVTLDKYLISINQSAVGRNLPNKKTIMSKDHQIEFQGQLVPAYRFLEMSREVKKIKYTGEVLYNVLLAKPGLMTVNGLRCETLHPSNLIAKLYTSHCSNQLVHQLNTALLEKDAPTYMRVLNSHTLGTNAQTK
jgi:hypothetical protein